MMPRFAIASAACNGRAFVQHAQSYRPRESTDVFKPKGVVETDDHIKHIQERIDFIEGHDRKKCASMLFVGTVFGFCGFLFAFLLGTLNFYFQHKGYEGKFKSGLGYFPTTVSEMVHDPDSPAGKCFFAFEIIASIFVFLSWYPFELRNVYVGDDDTRFRISWPMWRQYLPAPGLMLVACITTTPMPQANYLDYICIFIHLTAACSLFIGYVVIEGHTIGWWVWKEDVHRMVGVGMMPRELRIRRFLVGQIALWYAIFFAIQILLGLPGPLGGDLVKSICCDDVWIHPKDAPPSAPQVVKNTAYSTMLYIKLFSYMSEVICGCMLLMSHLTIWYYSEERNVDLRERLFDSHEKQASEHAMEPAKHGPLPAVPEEPVVRT